MAGGVPCPTAEAAILIESDSDVSEAVEQLQERGGDGLGRDTETCDLEGQSSRPSCDGPSPKRRKCGGHCDSGQMLLHVEQTKPWNERLEERGIREVEDLEEGQLKLKARYISTEELLTPEDKDHEEKSKDEVWWLKNTPPPPITQSRTRHRRDRPSSLSHFEVGDKVFVRELKGTVVCPHSDSKDDSDKHQLKCNTVPVKFKGSDDAYIRVRRSKLRDRKINLNRDQPSRLSDFEVGSEVSVEGLKGTVVCPNSDSEEGSDEHRLKCNKVAVNFEDLGDTNIRVRRSKMRNRTIKLINLPEGWRGKINQSGNSSNRDTLQEGLCLSSQHHRIKKQESLASFLRDREISKTDCKAVEASHKEALLRARKAWPWLFDEEDSDASSGDDYDGKFCRFCGDGGLHMVECQAKGCKASKHMVCIRRSIPGFGPNYQIWLKSEDYQIWLKSKRNLDDVPEIEEWFCEQCRHEAFLLNRSVQTRVEACPGLNYLHQLFGAPASWSDANPVVCFEVPKMLPPPTEFALGVIHGTSGSGKSLLLAKRFGHPREEAQARAAAATSLWPRNRAIIGLVHSDPKEAYDRLLAVGLEAEAGKPWGVLSPAQQRCLEVGRELQGGAIFDHFTAGLDDTNAHSLCRGVARFVRERGLSNVIVASSHPRVVQWMRPDWSYCTDSQHMARYTLDDKAWAPRQPHRVSGADDAVRSNLKLAANSDARSPSPAAGGEPAVNPAHHEAEVPLEIMEVSDCEGAELETGNDHLLCQLEGSCASPPSLSISSSKSDSAAFGACAAQAAAGADASADVRVSHGGTAGFKLGARARGEPEGARPDGKTGASQEREEGRGNEALSSESASMRELCARAEALEARGDWKGARRVWDKVSNAAQELVSKAEGGRQRCQRGKTPLPAAATLEPELGGKPVTLEELRDLSWGGDFDACGQDILIRRVHHSAWTMFQKGHYLDKPGVDIKGAHVYVAFLRDGTPVGLVAVRCQPGAGYAKTPNGCYRESRLVVLKVWRGIGIASAISNAIAQAYTDAGCKYTRMNKNRETSKLWLKNRNAGGRSCPVPNRQSLQRPPKFSFTYVGDCSISKAPNEQADEASGDVVCVDSSSDGGCDWDDDGGPPIRIVGARHSEDSESDGGEGCSAHVFQAS